MMFVNGSSDLGKDFFSINVTLFMNFNNEFVHRDAVKKRILLGDKWNVLFCLALPHGMESPVCY